MVLGDEVPGVEVAGRVLEVVVSPAFPLRAGGLWGLNHGLGEGPLEEGEVRGGEGEVRDVVEEGVCVCVGAGGDVSWRRGGGGVSGGQLIFSRTIYQAV